MLADGRVRYLGREPLDGFDELQRGDGWWYGELPGVDDATAITHGCALRRDGRVLCWGWLATAAGAESREPTPVALEGPATQLVGAGRHACALLDDGRARCWGDDRLEQLGDGARTTWLDDPVAVEGTGVD